jgi:hypothetical protein
VAFAADIELVHLGLGNERAIGFGRVAPVPSARMRAFSDLYRAGPSLRAIGLSPLGQNAGSGCLAAVDQVEAVEDCWDHRDLRLLPELAFRNTATFFSVAVERCAK